MGCVLCGGTVWNVYLLVGFQYTEYMNDCNYSFEN